MNSKKGTPMLSIKDVILKKVKTILGQMIRLRPDPDPQHCTKQDPGRSFPCHCINPGIVLDRADATSCPRTARFIQTVLSVQHLYTIYISLQLRTYLVDMTIDTDGDSIFFCKTPHKSHFLAVSSFYVSQSMVGKNG